VREAARPRLARLIRSVLRLRVDAARREARLRALMLDVSTAIGFSPTTAIETPHPRPLFSPLVAMSSPHDVAGFAPVAAEPSG
jgi:hypothetical protein